MRNLFYVLAVFFVVIWAIGFLGYNIGGIVHVLLVVGLLSAIIRIIQTKKIIRHSLKNETKI